MQAGRCPISGRAVENNNTSFLTEITVTMVVEKKEFISV